MRKPGFYWVKEANMGWVVAEYGGLYWHFANIPYDYFDSDMEEIDERRLVFSEIEYESWKSLKERRKNYTDISDK